MQRVNRQQSQTQTRIRLRGAAVQQFARRGVAAASIDCIAEAAGFSRGAFYANYSGKRDMLLEVVHESHAAEVAIWTGLIAQAPGLDQVMGDLAARFELYAVSNDLALLQVELQLEASRDPEFCAVYQEYNERLLRTVEGLLRTLFAKAARSAPADIPAIAQTLRALTFGLILQATSAETHGAKGAIVTRFLRSTLDLPSHNGTGEAP